MFLKRQKCLNCPEEFWVLGNRPWPLSTHHELFFACLKYVLIKSSSCHEVGTANSFWFWVNWKPDSISRKSDETPNCFQRRQSRILALNPLAGAKERENTNAIYPKQKQKKNFEPKTIFQQTFPRTFQTSKLTMTQLLTSFWSVSECSELLEMV